MDAELAKGGILLQRLDDVDGRERLLRRQPVGPTRSVVEAGQVLGDPAPQDVVYGGRLVSKYAAMLALFHPSKCKLSTARRRAKASGMAW